MILGDLNAARRSAPYRTALCAISPGTLRISPGALRHIGSRAAMVHSDIGSGDKSESPRRAHTLAPLLAPGAIVVSDQDMAVVGWSDVAPPAGITPGRYYMYRVA